jgi:RND family efflux transporter MFP subunit
MTDSNQDSIVADDAQVPTRNVKQRLTAVALIAVLLVAGIATFKYLMATKPAAKRQTPVKMQVLVESAKVSPSVEPVVIKAFGRVKPAKEISLQARVAGSVVMVHKDLIPGGIVRKGEVLVQLDDTDYLLALRQKKDTLAQAQADLRIEEGNQNVAKQEWQLITSLTDGVDSSTDDLALRKPQLAKAEVKIQTAQTDVERSEIDLSRTTVTAPFDAIIIEKNIDVGSQITTQSVIAKLVGVDHFWVEISVPTMQLPWIVMPGAKSNGSDSKVFSAGGHFKGRILKLLPDLEEDGLMARLLIEITDPMALKTKADPLLINSFVRVEITGREIGAVYKIPRFALHENKTVYTVSAENSLHMQPVSVAWEDAEFAYLDGGLSPETPVIISAVPGPIEGMPLKMSGQDHQQQKGLQGE